MVGLLAMQIIPDFGPMRKAVHRAQSTGKLIRDGATPMMSKELTELKASDSGRVNLGLNFIVPVAIVISLNLTTFIIAGKTSVLKSFMAACAYLGTVMWLQRIDDIRSLARIALAGMKGVLPAIVILGLAYCVNTISKEMNTALFVVQMLEGWLAPGLLPVLAFLIAGVISFAIGTSWGTYAIMIPIALPLAFQFSGGETSSLVLATFAAIAGGGVFGDHASPLSDTTVLSSLGSACDHIDYVKTQLPYTLTVALLTCVAFAILGL